MREFNATMAQYLEHNKREIADIVNFKLKEIAFAALKNTKMADRERIAYRLGQTASLLSRNKKTGKTYLRKRVLGEGDTFARRIVLARLRHHGKAPESEADLRSRVQKYFAASLRSVAFIKSGWLPAIRKLKPLAKGRGNYQMDRGVKQFGPDRGNAKPATWGVWDANGWVENSAIEPKGKLSRTTGNPERFATQGLQAGINAEVRSMRKYIEDKLQKLADKVRGR